LGREVIEASYPLLDTAVALAQPEEFRRLPVTQSLIHSGRPQALQALDQRALLTLGSESGGVVEVVSSVGDTLVEGTLLLRVMGGRRQIEEKAWKKAFETGDERT